MPRHIKVTDTSDASDTKERRTQRPSPPPLAGDRTGQVPSTSADSFRQAPREAGGLRLVPEGERRSAAPVDTPPPHAAGRADGGPCWLSLAARDHLAAKEFYDRVLGWCHIPLPDPPHHARLLALKAGTPVGTVSRATCDLGVSAGWIPYFAVTDVDTTVGRLRERGATVAVGPLTTHTGRIAVAAGPQNAVFGLREKAPFDHWRVGDGPVARLELYTRDIFATALFYGGVLGWAGGSRDSCEVEYVDGQISVRDGLRTVAALKEAAFTDGALPGWHACFRVTDVDMTAAAAVGWGGRVVSPPSGPGQRREAVLGDREGNPFTVIAS